MNYRFSNIRLKNAQKMMLDAAIEPSDYKTIRENLENEMATLKLNCNSFTKQDTTLTSYINFTTQIIENFDPYYLSANLDLKARILGWMFPEKIKINKNGLPTLKTNNFISLISNTIKGFSDKKNGTFGKKTEKSQVVIPSGTFSNPIIHNELAELYAIKALSEEIKARRLPSEMKYDMMRRRRK